MRTNSKRLFAPLAIAIATAGLSACNEDGGPDPQPDPISEAWIGSWLSAGNNVSPLLAGDPFNIDSLRVAFDEDLVVTASQLVVGGAWTTFAGTYTVVESASGDADEITIDYEFFSQGGIGLVTSGNPDELMLEVVQTIPDFGFVPRTPETGFGSDPLYGTTNIQIYEREQ